MDCAARISCCALEAWLLRWRQGSKMVTGVLVGTDIIILWGCPETLRGNDAGPWCRVGADAACAVNPLRRVAETARQAWRLPAGGTFWERAASRLGQPRGGRGPLGAKRPCRPGAPPAMQLQRSRCIKLAAETHQSAMRPAMRPAMRRQWLRASSLSAGVIALPISRGHVEAGCLPRDPCPALSRVRSRSPCRPPAGRADGRGFVAGVVTLLKGRGTAPARRGARAAGPKRRWRAAGAQSSTTAVKSNGKSNSLWRLSRHATTAESEG
jgi:hypothetical protein